MATYHARLSAEPDGKWVAASVELPHCWSRAATPEDALKRLRDEIRYRIELCPCSGVDDAYVQVELEVGGRSRATPVASATPQRRERGPRAADGRRARAQEPSPAELSGVAGCPQEPARRAPAPREAFAATQPGVVWHASRPARATASRGAGWRRWDD